MTNEKNDVIVEEKKKSEKKKKFSGIASVSAIISLFDLFGNFIYDSLINGFLGKIFTSYSKLQSGFEKSLFGKLLFGNHRIRRAFRRIRKFLSSIIDSSFFINGCKRASSYFCSLPLSFYGNFTFVFGIYTVIMYFVKLLLFDTAQADESYLMVGGCLFIASLFLMFSRVSLALAVKKSVILKMLFMDAFGFTEETFDQRNTTVKGKGNYMLFLGLLAGMLSFFVHPMVIIIAIFSIVVLAVIASAPEIGVLITVVSIPFLSLMENPTMSLCFLVSITAIFYVIKLIRGKRVFKLELLDMFVLIFGGIIFLSTLFGAGGEAAFFEACVVIFLLLGYFLLVNLMRTERWIKRCVIGLITSATVVAVIGVFEYFFGESSGQWLDLSLFSDIPLRVVSLFENPNVLSTFIVMVFPFVLAAFCLTRHANERILLAIVGAFLVACTVFTWSRGSWLAMIVSTLLFFLIYNRKSFRIFGAAIVLVPVLVAVIPDNVYNRLLSITNLSDSSISYRIYTWKGTLGAIQRYFFGGIGFGNDAFKNIYPQYAYSGMEAAEHSHSLFLQVFLALGIVGVIVLAVILFLSVQKFFEYLKAPESRSSSVYMMAVIASLTASAIMGVFDYIWYNYRVFYVFWIIIAIGCAFVRVGNYELERKKEAVQYKEQIK